MSFMLLLFVHSTTAKQTLFNYDKYCCNSTRYSTNLMDYMRSKVRKKSAREIISENKNHRSEQVNLLLGLMMMMNSLSLGQQLNNFRFRIKCKTHYKAYHVGMGRKETVFCLNCVSSLRSETNRSNSKVPLDLHSIRHRHNIKRVCSKKEHILFSRLLWII